MASTLHRVWFRGSLRSHLNHRALGWLGLGWPGADLHVEHLGSRLPGVYEVRALPGAVGLDVDARERMEAYRPLWAAFWLAMLLPGNGGWRRNPRGTTEDQAAHFIALVARD